MKHLLTLCLVCLIALPVHAAGPPSHAPAHGYRNKEAKFRGHTGTEWERDYGVSSGRCDTDAVLAVLGGAAGAVIGNRTADREHRTVATIAGAVLGALIGNEIGDAIDDADRGCMGHSLEMARDGQAVRWTNPKTRATHVLTPVRDLSGVCRLFTYRIGDRRAETLRGCRNADAAWVIRRN